MGLRSAVKLGALCAHSSVTRALVGPGRGVNPVVLMYHRVLDPSAETFMPEPGTWVSTEMFKLQVSFLREVCEIVPLPYLLDSLRRGSLGTKRMCALTFDDGWLDNLTNALPVLIDHQIPAAVFVTTACITTGKPPWPAVLWDLLMRTEWGIPVDPELPGWPPAFRSALWELSSCGKSPRREEVAARCMNIAKHLPAGLRSATIEILADADVGPVVERQVLDWGEIRKMRDVGIDFGSHTRSHAILTQLGREELEREVKGSKQDLEDALGQQMLGFAYPNGDWDVRTRDVVSGAGFRCAFTTRQSLCSQDADRFALPRIGVHEGTSKGLSSFSEKAFGLRLGII